MREPSCRLAHFLARLHLSGCSALALCLATPVQAGPADWWDIFGGARAAETARLERQSDTVIAWAHANRLGVVRDGLQAAFRTLGQKDAEALRAHLDSPGKADLCAVYKKIRPAPRTSCAADWEAGLRVARCGRQILVWLADLRFGPNDGRDAEALRQVLQGDITRNPKLAPYTISVPDQIRDTVPALIRKSGARITRTQYHDGTRDLPACFADRLGALPAGGVIGVLGWDASRTGPNSAGPDGEGPDIKRPDGADPVGAVRIRDSRKQESRTLSCGRGYRGSAKQTRNKVTTTVTFPDWMVDAGDDNPMVLVTYGNWSKPDRSACKRRRPRYTGSRGGGSREGVGYRSYDVGDRSFEHHSDARAYADRSGGRVRGTSNTCQGCNGEVGGQRGKRGGRSGANGGGRRGGGCGFICFATGTPVEMADGTTRPVETLRPGDALRTGGRVLLILRSRSAQLCELGGTHVTRGHWVRHKGRWIAATDHPDARPVRTGPVPVWSLLSEHGVIRSGGYLYADLLTMRDVIGADLRQGALDMTLTSPHARLEPHPMTAARKDVEIC
ncbi:hypothetical protein [Ruegeria sp.]|uniref:hypothetical protein n=1 Tax=Ruegeria sp. TaxID=1879320 RepID=UPI003B0094F3